MGYTGLEWSKRSWKEGNGGLRSALGNARLIVVIIRCHNMEDGVDFPLFLRNAGDLRRIFLLLADIYFILSVC